MMEDEELKPTHKHPEIDRMLASLTPTGMTRQEAAEKRVCTWCGKPIEGFKDELSKREYRISGMCQNCQDETFTSEEEEEQPEEEYSE